MKLRDDKLRSSCPEAFYKKGAPRNFAKFTGQHLCQRLFLNKVAERLFFKFWHRPATLSKKSLWHRRFPVNFAKFLRTPFLQNSSGGCFCKLQVNEKNSFTHTPSCILPSFSKNTSFSQNTSRLLLPKRLWKCKSTISLRKYKRKVVLLKKQSPEGAL